MLGEAHVLVNLSAPDLEEAAAFYQEELGLPLELRHEVMPGHEELRFTTSGATLCITQGEPPQPQTKELVSFKVDDVNVAVQGLRERGVTSRNTTYRRSNPSMALPRWADTAPAGSRIPAGTFSASLRRPRGARSSGR